MKKFMAPTPFRQFVGMLDSVPKDLIEPEDNGTPYPSLRLNAPPEKPRINSGRDPFREAERQVELWSAAHLPANNPMIVMIGCSGLAHLELLHRKSPHNQIFVIEPDPAVFIGMLCHCDLAPLKQCPPGAFYFSVNPSRDFVMETLKDHLRANSSGQAAIFTTPGLERLFPEEYHETAQQVETALKLEEQNRNTEAIFASLWFGNAITNFSKIITLPEIGCLKDRFSGTTAIIAAAGPGLNAMLPWIKSVANKHLIIAVGTSLRSLVNAGIEPDFVVAVDSSAEIVPQFQGVKTSRCVLVGAYTLTPQVFDFFPGRTLLFTADLLKGVNLWLEQLGVIPQRLRVGGTVSLSAIDFAIHLGCRRLILAGLDLAFAPDGATHAAGTIYEKSRITSGSWLTVAANHGGTVLTSRQFASYIKMLEDYFADLYNHLPELHIFNTSGCGAKIAGAADISPQKIKEIRFPVVQNEKPEYIFNCMGKSGSRPTLAELLPQLTLMRNELNMVAGDTATAMSELESFIAGHPVGSSQDLLELLDRIDSSLKRQSMANLLLENVLAVFSAGQAAGIGDTGDPMRENHKIYACFHEYAAWAADKFGRIISDAQLIEGEKNG